MCEILFNDLSKERIVMKIIEKYRSALFRKNELIDLTWIESFGISHLASDQIGSQSGHYKPVVHINTVQPDENHRCIQYNNHKFF